MARAIVTEPGGLLAPPSLLGLAPARIPTGGRIRPGIMVLTRRAAEDPQATEIYREGVAKGESFEAIARTLAEALPSLKAPLVPRNVPWFTVRAQDFANPEMAEQILQTYGEDRGRGRRLYRFPVVFPSDHWQTVMPHELAAWSTHDKRFWSQYSPDGQLRQCMRHALPAMDASGRRVIRVFGGRKAVPREENGGLCDPEACPEYQARQCNLTGRFLFFMPGIRSISALELPTTSFYAMSHAIQRFQAVAQMRGGRISGFLGRDRASFYFSKVLKQVAHIDEQGRAVRVAQWIIELEAPVDVTALLREQEDEETLVQQARLATQIVQGEGEAVNGAPALEARGLDEAAALAGEPSLAQLRTRVLAMGLAPAVYARYAERRWGAAWREQATSRARACDELARYAKDPVGFRDKVETELRMLG